MSIQSGENYERILVRKSWTVENSSIVKGFIFDGQMGAGYPYHDTDGNRITIVGTSDWCSLFRVYTIKEIKGKSK